MMRYSQLQKEMKETINNNSKELASKGMQVIALASKQEYRGKGIFNFLDENNMTFYRFCGISRPTKKK